MEMADPVIAACPGCTRKLKLDAKFSGRRVKCPRCGEPVSVPVLPSQGVDDAFEDETFADERFAAEEPRRSRSRSRRSEATEELEEERPRRRSRARGRQRDDPDDFEEVDESYDEYDEYEEERPRRNRSRRSSSGRAKRSSSSRSKRGASSRNRRSRESAATSGGVFNKGTLGGLAMMVIATVWFFVALQGGVIFFYPPVMFVLGLGSVISGLVNR